jgi:hypothetical protein
LRSLHHHAAESRDDAARAQAAEAMSLRFAAFGGTDLLLEFAPPPIDRIGHGLIHSKLRSQLDPQAWTAQRRAFAAGIGPGASIMLRANDASMAVGTPCFAR